MSDIKYYQSARGILDILTRALGQDRVAYYKGASQIPLVSITAPCAYLYCHFLTVRFTIGTTQQSLIIKAQPYGITTDPYLPLSKYPSWLVLPPGPIPID